MTSPSIKAEFYAELFLARQPLVSESIHLDFGRCHITIKSNSQRLLDNLNHYFSPVISEQLDTLSTKPKIEIIAIEREVVELGLEFKDWAREPGKTGKKDAFFNLDDGRLVNKVRTGMLFLQNDNFRIACGPCIQNESQVINFINMQYMIWLQHHDWLICHASAFVYKKKAIGVAAFSGGGKSTFMLKTLDNPEINYLTNDRLFIKTDGEYCLAAGIPKMPRVNPGTIISNPKIKHLLSEQRVKELEALSKNQLWDLEEKYDVLIDEVYGPKRIESEAELDSIIVLNWERESASPFELNLINIAERRELLPAIMKSPGSFYPSKSGEFDEGPQELDESKYLASLSKVKIYEAAGRVDFDELKSVVFSKILRIHEQ